MRNFLYQLVYYSGLNYLVSLFLNKKLYVVMYHSVSDESDHDRLKHNLYTHISINREAFEKQVLYMKKKGHTFISLADVGKEYVAKLKKPTVIYFDDGFKDAFLHAAPFLKKNAIPATFFMVSGILDKTDMIWSVQYKDTMTKKGMSKNEQHETIEKIKRGTEADRKQFMKSIPLSSDVFDIYMTWDDTRSLLGDGFQIGSHSTTHPRLNECSPNELKHEVVHSKERLESELKTKVVSFSFPHGRYNEEVVKNLTDAGYTHLISFGKGLNNPKDFIGKNSIELRNASPKPNEPWYMFPLRLYMLNLRRS